MEFTVTFTTNDRNLPLVEKLGSAGVDLLDLVRETYPLARDLEVNKVWFNDNCPIDGHCMATRLNEEQARSSSLFKGRTEVQVVVPAASFAKFIDLDFDDRYTTVAETHYLRPALAKTSFLRWMTERRTAFTHKLVTIIAGQYKVYTQKLTAINVSYIFLEEEMLNKWAAAGYPLEWRP
ncbi:MAG TPA: hypothetical protein VI911_06970 [Patescibacteria group bacterium]|nr:hypothetical protein [Patescibacteria group bacterium]